MLPLGNGQKTRRAFVPAGRLKGFRIWLEGLVGPLVHYEVAVRPTPPVRINGVKIQAGNSSHHPRDSKTKKGGMPDFSAPDPAVHSWMNWRPDLPLTET
jgi:hypothetical protein